MLLVEVDVKEKIYSYIRYPVVTMLLEVSKSRLFTRCLLNVCLRIMCPFELVIGLEINYFV